MFKKNYKKKIGAWESRGIGKLKIPPQFVAQPMKQVQEIKRVGKLQKLRLLLEPTREMVLGYEKGKDLRQIKHTNKKWLAKNKKEIAKELANTVAELNLKYGVAHMDLAPTNILIQRKKNKKLEIKLIDFEHSVAIEKEELKELAPWETVPQLEHFAVRQTFFEITRGDIKESEKLFKIFQKQYEKKAKEIL